VKTSVVNSSKIDLGDRIDAEYFEPTYVENENRLKRVNAKPLSNYCKLVSSAFYPAATEFYTIGEMPFIRCVDCIEFPAITSLQNETFEKLPRHFIKENRTIKILNKEDIVITKVGTPCYASIIYDIDELALSRTVLGVIKIKQIDPYYLTVYLRSKYGYDQLFRERELTIQYQLTLERVGRILVYKPLNEAFEKLIGKLFVDSQSLFIHSREKYKEVEQILLSELGLVDWKPKYWLSFVKNFSDVQSANRIDAEYFQPIYDEVINAIKSYRNGWDTLGNQFSQNKKGFRLIPDSVYHYVEISCVRTSDGYVEPLTLHGNELPPNAKIKLFKDDIIVSKVRPYRGAIGIIDSDNYVGSSAFTVLQASGNINKESLITLLRIKPYLQLSLKYNTGTSYPTITDNDVLNLPIPFIPRDVQDKIKKKITDADENRANAKLLLDIAKLGIEMAIEQNEEAATRWLKEEIELHDVTLKPKLEFC